ncbi:acyltransferase family protein [Burkholderia multivorans]|uniref:acyltransferase family protein n=1 Tax=Burkholderia multivorans TaxID=87883 RepID=UPI0012DCEF21|nr:acyltransferase [Burkholderia multivorans]MBN6732450.1 acyltransferase [Burkholderia multivorans]MBN7125571.1 acyltransferase [Burkholderia multivorans]MBN8166266.1 acyltransferase [Burkholderia multivorans]MBN8172056.1 acyltransferase [Burkholderia multivorans]MBN8177841.1 acyltransferase [Burkholderia multivorans]
MDRNERIHELDSLRGLAAIGVIAWHYTNHFHASPFPALMAPFYRHGLLLVDFFFVLSGFVLARTYWNERRAGDLVANIRDRIARLYPLHFATLCLVAAMQWLLVHSFREPAFVYTFNDKYDFFLNLFLLNRTGLERGWSFNAPSWSISTEFIVNTAFLFCISTRRRASEVLLAVFLTISAIVILRNGLISNARTIGIDNDIFRATLGFGVGVILFRISGSLERIRAAKPICDAIALTSISCFLYYCAKSPLSNTSDLAMMLICFPLLIVSATRGALVKKLLRLPPLVFLGTISYSIYLVHFPLQLAMHTIGVASGRELPYASRALFAVFMAVTVFVSWITYRSIELPGKNVMRKLLGRRRTAPTAQPN